jgi:hypothetical protein
MPLKSQFSIKDFGSGRHNIKIHGWLVDMGNYRIGVVHRSTYPFALEA